MSCVHDIQESHLQVFCIQQYLINTRALSYDIFHSILIIHVASPAVIQGQTSQQNFLMFSLSKQINDAEMYWGWIAPDENFPSFQDNSAQPSPDSYPSGWKVTTTRWWWWMPRTGDLALLVGFLTRNTWAHCGNLHCALSLALSWILPQARTKCFNLLQAVVSLSKAA